MFDKKEYMKKYNKQYKKDNPEYYKKYMEEYRLKNKDKAKIYFKRYRLDNKDKLKILNHKYHLNNKDERNTYGKQWYKGHKKEKNEYFKNRFEKDLKFNLNSRMGCLIWQSLKNNKKGQHWENLVEYKLSNLIKRLKKTMPKDYTWQDYLKGKLHIDHIIPKSVFNYTKPEHIDFKHCWALKNLKLLPGKENIKKSDNLDKPFQPALKIKN